MRDTVAFDTPFAQNVVQLAFLSTRNRPLTAQVSPDPPPPCSDLLQAPKPDAETGLRRPKQRRRVRARTRVDQIPEPPRRGSIDCFDSLLTIRANEKEQDLCDDGHKL
jgi:hypothetical protein